MIATFLAACLLGAPDSLTLEKGGPGDGEFRYWAVRDTFIDQTEPERNFGRDLLLEGGANKSILVSFGDLERITQGRSIVSATLVLNQEIGEPPTGLEVRRLNRSWREGPFTRGLRNRTFTTDGVPAPAGATWTRTDIAAGGSKWGSAGARDTSDGVPIADARATYADGTVRIEGLARVLEAQRLNPNTVHGLLLRFRNDVAFTSSDAPKFGPRLELTLGEPKGPTEPALIPAQGWPVSAEDSARLQRAVRFVNETLFPQSRFSFAPEGVIGKVSIGGPSASNVNFGAPGLRNDVLAVLRALGLPQASERSDLFAGVSGYGDSRDDLRYPRVLGLSHDPIRDENVDNALMRATDLLGATEVAWLNAKSEGKTPAAASQIAMRLTDDTGRPLSETKLEAVVGAKVVPLPPLRGGSIIVKLSDLGFNDSSSPLETVTLRPVGQPENRTSIAFWQVLDASARGLGDIAFVPILMPSGVVADTDTNLISTRLARTSTEDSPEPLMALTDGAFDRSWAVPEKATWIEFDLGRDRAIAEVRIAFESQPWSEVKVLSATTGTAPERGATWNDSAFLDYRIRRYGVLVGGEPALVLRGTPSPTRYLRLVFPAQSGVKIKEVQVFPVRSR